MPRLRSSLAACAAALLILPAVAGAHPGQRGLQQTFPVASRLCLKVANGHAPKRLGPVSAEVIKLCATLRTSFTDAQNGYLTTVSPLKQQASAVIAQTRQTCRTATPQACRQAREQARMTLKGLRVQVRAAADVYRTAIQTARKAFWEAIHKLAGDTAIAPDKGTPVAPSTPLPGAP